MNLSDFRQSITGTLGVVGGSETLSACYFDPNLDV